MPDVVFRVLLPLYGVYVVAAVVAQRLRLLKETGRDPIVIRPFRKSEAAHEYLESALVLGGPALGVDVVLNGVWPDMVNEHLAISVLRNATLLGYAGVVLITAGILLSGVAVRQMGASWRIGVDREKPGALVTRGLFRHIRHPIYAGMLLAASGMAAATADLLSVVVAAAAWVGLPVQARLEEQFLASVYGEGYKSYLAKTGRFWPRPCP
jgi:protein-S-isoprenylcysteine O-methyltransferase Ste14